ncbi:branched-chain amino acid ABC transporter substrate-binding protein [Metarhizobium album]|uniref:Branched-chain amino acid ABC transporter substrate-binding protein n=2 Tax=Metarhizobium album TaxID=2182425 RepID=A0A2U2DJL7_9HYPH|nr:branched-chain amino acid ABC transporter substrate-binding protein [Rhizobium album]
MLGTFLAGASSASAADITVCMWGTITGPDALLNGMSYGTRDYIEYINQTQGGIAGNKIKTLLLDGRYKLDEEQKNYRRCVGEENAVYVKGWSTGAVKALRDQIQSDAVPFMTDSHASEVLDPAKLPYIFMAGPTYEQQLLIGLRAAAEAGGKRVVVMHANNEYGRAPVEVVRKSGEIEKLGLELVDQIEFPFDTQDLTGQILRLKNLNPDAVYIQASTPQVLVILRDAAKVGLPASLFTGNIYNIAPAIIEQLGPAAEGFRAIQIYSDFGSDIPATADMKKFEENNKIEKRDPFYMKGWYEGIAMVAAIRKAVEKAGGVPDDIVAFRKSVRDEMEGLTGLDTGGITPPVSYANHQGTTQARITEIKDGAYVPVSDWIGAH